MNILFIILQNCPTKHFETCFPCPFKVQRLRLWAEYVEFLQFVYSTSNVIVCNNLLPFSRQVLAMGQSSWGTQLTGKRDINIFIYIQAKISSIKSLNHFKFLGPPGQVMNSNYIYEVVNVFNI